MPRVWRSGGRCNLFSKSWVCLPVSLWRRSIFTLMDICLMDSCTGFIAGAMSGFWSGGCGRCWMRPAASRNLSCGDTIPLIRISDRACRCSCELSSLETGPFCPVYPPRGTGIRHALTNPKNGSACKRLNLFLRWMVRRGALDVGVWQSVSPAQRIILLNTRMIRLGRRLGLTGRASPG